MYSSMSPVTVLATALLTALLSGLCSPWARGLAGGRSRWLHFPFPAFVGGLAGAGAGALARSWAELVAFAALAVASSLLLSIDLAVHRLPDIIVGPMYLVLLGTLTVAAATGDDWSRLGRAAAAMAVLATGYFVLAFISPASLGLGDVKLAGLLGAFLGWLGWSQTLLGALSAFVLVGLWSGVLLLTRRVQRTGSVAFGPWMILGAALGAASGVSALV
jgi:leader peptidase (prepilin peptidase)/N-methyltransferase